MVGTLDRATDETPTEPAVTKRPGSSGRLVGIDIARAVALMGMFTQHVSIFDDGDGRSTGWVAWLFTEFSGRAAVLFFVLSGVSLSIIHGRNSASAQSAALYRRGFLLLTGGILLTISIWPASILQQYGVAFLLAPLLLRFSRVGLAVGTVAGLIGGPILLLFAQNWSDDVNGLWEGQTGSWLITNVWDILVSGIYPMVLWIGFFMFGMLVGRIDLSDRRNLLRLGAAALLAATAFGMTANALTDRYGTPDFEETFQDDFDEGEFAKLEKKFDENGDERFGDKFGKKFDDGFDEQEFFPEVPADWRSLYDVTGHSGRIGWTMQTGALAVAALSLALLIPARLTRFLKPLAWMGSMSLTAYLVHILLVTDVFGPFIENADWSIGAKELAFGGLVVSLVAICSVFYGLFKTGPLEWLLKQFTLPRRAPRVDDSSA